MFTWEVLEVLTDSSGIEVPTVFRYRVATLRFVCDAKTTLLFRK